MLFLPEQLLGKDYLTIFLYILLYYRIFSAYVVSLFNN